MNSTINIDELETLFKLVVEKLKLDKVNEVEFDMDEYLFISSDEWTEFSASPKPITGSLSEDIEYLKRAVKENEIFTYCDLDRLSAVLRAISEIQAPINGTSTLGKIK